MPERIARLAELAYNLWWSWHPDARALFAQLDISLWQNTHHNPVHMLKEISAERLEEAARDTLFRRNYDKVMMTYDREMQNGHTWFQQNFPELKTQVVGYFSFEFGLHNSLPIYSGGLGILAGDHAKEASDVGLPLVGVGFMYPQGYFRQRLPSHGWQEAVYEQLDLSQTPILPFLDETGREIRIGVRISDREVFARIWHVRVGRTPLYLMDTDVDDNDPWDRELSARLYSGDSEQRIRQEIMLGIGGVRTLRTLNIQPSVWHMNEGHSAFLLLECIREKVAAGESFAEALAEVRTHSLFTTHTPVAAGHDAFPFHMVEKYFNGYWEEMGLSREKFLDLGKHQEEWGTAFNMTVLALRLSGQANGVSKLHGEVSRRMWQSVWPDRDVKDVPIGYVTNGIHVPTWVPSEMYELYAKYLGPNWVEQHDDPILWERLSDIPDEELWSLHMELKRKTVSFFRERARRSWLYGHSDPTQILTGGTLLDPDALTIGFARRFPTYKRATLIFRDLERLQRLMLDRQRPVQLIFAGKAHPADDPGKVLIQTIYNLAKHSQLAGRVAFMEDYDMHMARYLVQGVDVWLNNPRRPREASGTSGQKAAVNGVPNFSVLDGWWAEGYNGANGWPIGQDKEYSGFEQQDQEDAIALYQTLEEEIVPLYYDRDRDNIPRGWVAIMRESIRSCAPHFSTRRMLKEYARLYIRAMKGEAG
ncbi:MAG: alpha-glucan family phosphorylase [Chloroflexi bacterium]|nr:alpha-glucan family phosphorylase [Chloroflexota bacterium]MCI0580050.1 alpha-glucan family phosphorylase [Chloroflexota bacterium]MCI0649758.1 alpha-glucan family phosphorylase [Chloroflexota bacterium]MCI0730217.1 alpha-glucan family phosphorylase [Chloroflexota bacterium]